MLSLNIPSYSPPSGYQISELPAPEISDPKDVLIKVHAASINPIDVKKAGGMLKMAVKDQFPYKIGYDCSGVVTQVGAEVTNLKVGDEVYSRLPEVSRGSCSEYVTCTEQFVAMKPPLLSFAEAASIPLAAMTALQALRKYDGDLAGKTVFVPAGLSGTGLFACQLAKHHFKAGKVITTVSTSKIPKIPELLGEGTVDQIIDYTKENPQTAIEPGSIDFLFDTVGVSMPYLRLMRPNTSRIISISTTPSGDQLEASSILQLPHRPGIPFAVRMALNATDCIRRFRARRYGVNYNYMFLESSGKDLDELTGLVEKGQLRTVVGTNASFKDIKAVRDACQVVYDGKGGLGKAVIQIVEE